ncbi:uncharacterized protein A1O9_01942 [Exophiala aquamarina CBS 119918]|uniref:Uncharacterized protein n=1 Tax=Exophiala aquamarina CBS 119918 TaxID=1182545 RepID=A0A072PKW9_9EURO|nr:uncharacterized protein A1O9_01942 [Exophiala aquamarina CBS 119918]KEF60382.1 hypothetical protein A1O9_01942 [Exophiala aquamarina CBS 119918]
MASDTEELNLYFYNPSTAVAIVFSALYFFLTLYHFHISILYARRQPIKHRYTIPLFVAALISTAGWSVRIASIKNKQSIPLYATSASYIVISPIFVCATLYLLLTRLIRSSLPEGPAQQVLFRIPPRWLGRIFITSDIFSFLTQCSGSGIASSGNWEGNLKEVGTNVLLVGLALQLATFSTFLLVLGRVVVRVKRSYDSGFNPCVKKVILGVWIAGFFVQVRSIYRVVEFGLGIDGYPFRNEWCLYVLEAAPMFIAIAVLGWYSPVKWMQQKSRTDFSLKEVQKNGNAGTAANGGVV